LTVGGSPARAQGYSPEEAPRRMTTPHDLEVTLFASEPLVRQPVAMTFDERGRLWVIQYLQYPNPAGLKRVQVDRYWRTIYDRVPAPPPRGPRGADRITILEDTDGDGQADRAHDFVDGLNLASGLLHGYGGLFVVQTPYLLFYADRDRDDRPDGDPEVLLSGFGMEDAHAVANSLAWGPDGWLYGAQGSTVTAHIGGVSFQQGIWRYHPRTQQFELFAEGGGNTWGLDFDRHGNLLAGTNVGGYALLHQAQGGYYWKSFAKHGELHHPYAFGYLEHVPYADFRGGHVTCGGIIYQGDSLPGRFHDRYIAANLLSHAVYWHELEPRGSSFIARHGGELLVAHDTWFAPVDLAVAPDGAIFVADWHDRRTAHPDPDADWDRTNGRIYRIQARDAKRLEPFDLTERSTQDLVALLASASGWHRAAARRLLIESGDHSIIDQLCQRAGEETSDAALEYLWALHGLGGLDESTAPALLGHPHEYVRAWVVRLLGDGRRIPDSLFPSVAALAANDSSPVVRAQLASTAARLPAGQALALLDPLISHDADADDPQIPLLLWWALERTMSEPEQVVAKFREPSIWKRRLVREHLTERLARRLTASATPRELLACRELLMAAATEDDRRRVVRGMNLGLRDKGKCDTPAELAAMARQFWLGNATDRALLELSLRLGIDEAREAALRQLGNRSCQPRERSSLAEMLGELGCQDAIPLLLELVEREYESPALRGAALAALGRFEDSAITHRLLACHASLPRELQPQAITVLCGRKSGAQALLAAVDTGRISPSDLTVDQLRQIAAHQDANLDAAVRRHWGQLRQATTQERLATVRRLNNDLRAAAGDTRTGAELFRKHCATCHRLFGEGESVGPDLTSANRGDRDFLLVSLVDPSAQIRKEYLSYNVQTRDGRVLNGIVVEEGNGELVVVDAKNQRVALSREQIEAIEPSEQSLMPEGLAEKLTPDELRDLFSYLQSSAPGE
jgi:putative membrane-bound dehydrogenase-like protein